MIWIIIFDSRFSWLIIKHLLHSSWEKGISFFSSPFNNTFHQHHHHEQDSDYNHIFLLFVRNYKLYNYSDEKKFIFREQLPIKYSETITTTTTKNYPFPRKNGIDLETLDVRKQNDIFIIRSYSDKWCFFLISSDDDTHTHEHFANDDDDKIFYFILVD